MKILIFAFVILLIITGILYYYVLTGVVVVNSSRPLEAVVEIDGFKSGNTPFKERVRVGHHNIKVYKEGFEPWEGKINVKRFSPTTITVKLRFLLQSDPTGASIKINGREVGVTDLAIDLPNGLYNIEFKKPGYQVAKFKATIPPNVSQPLPFIKLEKAGSQPKEEIVVIGESGLIEPEVSGNGSLQITSTPDAQIFIDGYHRGETPLTIKKIPVGSYVLKLSKEGYKDLRQTVYIRKDEVTKIAVELKPESPE